MSEHPEVRGGCMYIVCGDGDRAASGILKELERIARVCRANNCRAVLADGAEEILFPSEATEALADSSALARAEIENLAIALCTDVPASSPIGLAEIGTADGSVRVGFFDAREEALKWLAVR